MAAKRETPINANCGVAQTLNVVGDAWTLLVLREVFAGVTRFDALQRNLGIASNVLAARLRHLEDEGILERHAFREKPPRVEYAATEKGKELYPVLVALKRWGDRWKLGGKRRSAYRYVHVPCGAEANSILVCAHCGEPVGPDNVRREALAASA